MSESQTCAECGDPTSGDYELHVDTQAAVRDKPLHFKCIEERLGRELRPDDLTDAVVNDNLRLFWGNGWAAGGAPTGEFAKVPAAQLCDVNCCTLPKAPGASVCKRHQRPPKALSPTTGPRPMASG